MVVAVLGTGSVGRALSERLAELGHEVRVGTRDVDATRARSLPPAAGGSFTAWLDRHAGVAIHPFTSAAESAEVVVVALRGDATLGVLHEVGAAALAGKVVVDVTNPLEREGMPPGLFVANDDSLAERIQRAFPAALVVKTLNTVTAALMVRPQTLAEGDHSVFVSADDQRAKARVVELLRSFGWRDVIDLGGLSTARGAEMYLALWLRLYGAVGTSMLNVKVVR